jgi:hypothetical protein
VGWLGAVAGFLEYWFCVNETARVEG